MYLVYLPEWLRLSGSTRASPHREEVLGAAAELKIPVVDMVPAFLGLDDPLAVFPFRMSGTHYNRDGYRAIADAVLEVIGPGAGDRVALPEAADGAGLPAEGSAGDGEVRP